MPKRPRSDAPKQSVAKRPKFGAKMRTTMPRSRVPMRIGEVKGVDTLLTLASVLATTNTNAGIFVANLVPPGTASFNRIGKKVYNKSLRLRGQVTATITSDASSNLNNGLVRMVVVWDRQPSSAAIPTFDTIFGVTDQAAGESSTFLAPIRYDNSDRFTILRDRVFEMNAKAISPATLDTYVMQKEFDEYVMLGNRESVFSGQTSPASIADLSTGALYVVFRASSNTADSFVASVSANSFSRFRYTD